MAKRSSKKALTEAQEKRLAEVRKLMAATDKAFGKGSMICLGDDASKEISGIPTGLPSLDGALGGFGFPRGRIVELFGPESGGKSTLALSAVASTQREGGVAAYIDAEHALDPSWCKRLGVNIESLLLAQPGSAEETLQIVEMIVKSGAVDVMVVDSVAAMVPKAELEGEIGDAHVGVLARLMSQGLRKLTSEVARSNCILIFINQIRDKIGGMSFGPQTTTPGGRALKFYSSVRAEVTRIGPVKSGENVIGSRVKIKVVKNKVAPPFKTAELDLLYDSGFSAEGDLIDTALAAKVVDKSGAWYNFGDIRLGQGKEGARAFLKGSRETFDQIAAAVKAKAAAKDDEPEPESEDDEEAPEE